MTAERFVEHGSLVGTWIIITIGAVFLGLVVTLIVRGLLS
jgi:hypothetical protein